MGLRHCRLVTGTSPIAAMLAWQVSAAADKNAVLQERPGARSKFNHQAGLLRQRIPASCE